MWTEDEERYLKRIQLEAEGYYEYYVKKYHRLNKISNCIIIPAVALSGLNAVFALVLGIYVPQGTVSITNAVISMSTGLVYAAAGFLRLDERKSSCSQTFVTMKRISLKISRELCIERELRTTVGETVLQQIFVEWTEALEHAEPVHGNLGTILITP